jgi:TetR/AcrR family fatty acid metabolism transcriptional regulator
MRTARKTKKDVVTEFRMSEILDAARAVFGRKGFNDTTVDEIAEQAGLAKGTVYLYYKSKQDLYFEALRFGFTSLITELERQIEETEGIDQKLRAFIAAKLEYCEKNRDFFKIYYSELGNIPTHPAAINSKFKALYFEQARLVEGILKAGAQKGVVRSMPHDRTALAILDVIRGVITEQLLGWSRRSVQQDVDFIFNLIWKGIAR